MIRNQIRVLAAGLIVVGACFAMSTLAKAQATRSGAGGVVDITPVDLHADKTAQVVALPTGKARIIRLPEDARDVLVASPGIADIIIKTPRLAYLIGRGVGATNAFFFDAEGLEIARLEIRVEADVVAARQALDTLMPESGVEVMAVGDSIFLTGSVRSSKIAENVRQVITRFVPSGGTLVNLLGIAEDQQVLLQVRIAETTRSALKNIGIDLAATLTASNELALALVTGPVSTPGFLTFGATQTGRTGTLATALNALEQNGLVNTLAEPNLTAISGETASFLSGGEFPVSTVTEDGVQIDFKEFGVRLEFTPVVLDSGQISLRLAAEVSAIVNTVTGQLAVQRAETTVELPSGGSLVVGGLLQHTLATDVDGTPGLKDVPVLGTFFRENNLSTLDTELVFAVTAYLVKPINHEKLVNPTGNVAPPTDFELYFLGHLEAIYGDTEDGAPAPATALKGPIGYIVQ